MKKDYLVLLIQLDGNFNGLIISFLQGGPGGLGSLGSPGLPGARVSVLNTEYGSYRNLYE